MDRAQNGTRCDLASEAKKLGKAKRPSRQELDRPVVVGARWRLRVYPSSFLRPRGGGSPWVLRRRPPVMWGSGNWASAGSWGISPPVCPPPRRFGRYAGHSTLCLARRSAEEREEKSAARAVYPSTDDLGRHRLSPAAQSGTGTTRNDRRRTHTSRATYTQSQCCRVDKDRVKSEPRHCRDLTIAIPERGKAYHVHFCQAVCSPGTSFRSRYARGSARGVLRSSGRVQRRAAHRPGIRRRVGKLQGPNGTYRVRSPAPPLASTVQSRLALRHRRPHNGLSLLCRRDRASLCGGAHLHPGPMDPQSQVMPTPNSCVRASHKD